MSLLVCPACQHHQIQRSRRRGVVDYLLGWIGLYPYRCESCMTRFRLWGRPESE